MTLKQERDCLVQESEKKTSVPEEEYMIWRMAEDEGVKI